MTAIKVKDMRSSCKFSEASIPSWFLGPDSQLYCKISHSEVFSVPLGNTEGVPNDWPCTLIDDIEIRLH